MLRDMGAAIVKIEPPAGDPLSHVAPGWYAELSAGMEVLRLDLKSREGRNRLDNLLAEADLLLTATRPASLRRLGLSWPDLHGQHPRLCHVAIVGYAAPRQETAGHDLTYQAEAGLISAPAMPRTLIADLAGAQRVVIAALELLLTRERSGTAHVEVALAESASLFAEPLRHGLTSTTGPLGGAWAAYNIYPTRDGWLAVAALELQFRSALARDLSVDVDDPVALARVLAERPALEWERWAETRGLPLTVLREPV
jgi:crotonobetainyl-CoA:carnitine CoA-transferase CaiB-like acyl-CoA transferase